ncbi:hypothetical protein RJT34_17995 [Clitoria ternatea]|uniref:ATP synthase F1 complex delta/epsilon subunit N-terminal domain-containing protein n=1 Tax=Clitoria ternatea TaxID=43366 RepID=A0AAN9J9Z6_CLITE
MSFKLCVLTPNRIVWDSEVEEIILSTNSGQIGILPNHVPIATTVDIGILRIRLNNQWLKPLCLFSLSSPQLRPLLPLDLVSLFSLQR